MAYMLFMVEPVGQRRTRTPEEGRAVFKRMVEWGDDLKARGLLLDVQSLSGTDSAARVQVRNGKARVVDGPFAEAKEMVGGYFLVNVKTQAEAVALASQCPAAEWCTVEVRSLAPCYDESTAGASSAAATTH
ncbi:YciI family protein [Piscinibacter terrae]|uniref:Dehydrogenase n=1 Tax=Piscinibacter terrae TaxID=2496871 RepID=A0A3N7HME8_9BURK|nr:YciI family protein [Albitalea terrae]RQP22236.1 dehydrogenase [Albitalea terrae]